MYQPDGAVCDPDENVCTRDECQSGVCVHGPDDGAPCQADENPCTEDVCAGGVCTHPAGNDGAGCSDGDGCTVNDICSGGTCVGWPRDCDDDNPCTEDVCQNGACTHPPGNDGTACNDGDACTIGDSCVSGTCLGSPRNCDDDNLCTDDYCVAGGCGHAPNEDPCDDGDPCTLDDTCDGGVCRGRDRDCSDNNPCTDDACNPDDGGCVHTDNIATCDDGDPCTKADHCADGACTGTPDPECSWPVCATEYLVDGQGYARDFPYTRSARVIIPMGTDAVWLAVYYFSREYPYWTGQQSIFNDELSFAVSKPNGTIASGSATVNALDDVFELGGPGPGGNYLTAEELVDFGGLAQSGDSWIDLTGTATNIADGQLGSGVAFVVNCHPVDLALEDLSEDDEVTPGGYAWMNPPHPLPALTISAAPSLTGTVDFEVVSGDNLIQMYEDPDGTQPVMYFNESWPVAELPVTRYLEAVAGRMPTTGVQLQATYQGLGGTCEDVVNLTVAKLDLDIHNGGSDLDHGDAPGAPGTPVPDSDEETVGAYILVNWDDDDGDGSMNADGSWTVDPVPDLYENLVTHEDNLAKLVPTLQPALQDGTVELEISAGSSKIKLWTANTKQSEVVLTGSTKTWDLSDPGQRTAFQQLATSGLWIEGITASGAERDVTLVLRYRNPSGQELCSDTVKATVVMINLANAVYRENCFPELTADRGHAALVWWFLGSLTRENLHDDDKFLIIEIPGPTDTNTLSTMTDFTWLGAHYEAWGCFTNPAITYLDRLKILGTAKWFVDYRPVTWTPYNALKPKTWDGQLSTIEELRCDGFVEICYEINAVEVWGMVRTPDNNTVHYDITYINDEWTYHPVSGEWDHVSNTLPDNLEEHNDYDGGPWWKDTLMPATQCGHVAPEDADTRFEQHDLCIPVGSKGGNS